MSRCRILLLVLLAVLVAPICADAGDESYDKAAPWDRVRYVADGVDVRVAETWYRLVSIDGRKADDVLAFCRRTYGRRWDKRFAEDLVEVLTRMGGRPGPTADLVLRDVDGRKVEKKAVPMTLENRQAVWRAREAAERGGGESARVTRVSREHASRPDPRFVSLTRRVSVPSDAFEVMLTRKQAEEDLDQLEWHLTNEHSYVGLNSVDYRAVLDTIRAKLGAGISKGDLALQMHRVLCLFGDGHARVRGLFGEILGREQHGLDLVPFGDKVLLADTEVRDGEAAYEVVGIDGVPSDHWLEAVDDIVPRGSPQYRRRGRVRSLRYLPYLRARLGLPQASDTVLQLRSRDGRRSATRRAAVGERRGPYEPPPVSWELRGGVGYLRIREMDGGRSTLAAIDEAMRAFRETRGLVVDVRGNGGGSRDILRTLFPYLMRQGEMHVANVAAYRLPLGTTSGAAEGYLENRFLFPATSSIWTEAERNHVATFLESFVVDMVLPVVHFSRYHAMLLTPRLNPRAYPYTGRVVVLQDGGCFSATDVFLGALKGWRNVTLMGEASGGGSGRSKRGKLAHSGIRYRLSSMASFRPTGERYDGKGIQPDVVAAPEPEDVGTEKDSVLERTLAAAAKPLR